MVRVSTSPGLHEGSGALSFTELSVGPFGAVGAGVDGGLGVTGGAGAGATVVVGAAVEVGAATVLVVASGNVVVGSTVVDVLEVEVDGTTVVVPAALPFEDDEQAEASRARPRVMGAMRFTA